jgi:hypothetical protein
VIDPDLFRWPEGVLPPYPLNEQYQVTPPDPLWRTDFEEGDARQINAYSNAPGFYNVVWPLTNRQKFIFDGILANELAWGAEWFAIPVFTHREYQLLKCRIVKNSIKPTRQGGEWQVALQLETDDTQPPSATEAAFAAMGWDDDPDSLLGLVALLEQTLYIDLPGALS